MCFKTRPGTPSGPAALWFGVRRRASCIIVGVFRPDIVCIGEVGVGRTWPSQENGAPGKNAGSGERATVSICVSFVITSVGVVIRRPEDSFLRTERPVGRVEEAFPP